MVEFRRKFYDLLLRWKTEKHQECLLVKGARQIGKTFIIGATPRWLRGL